MSDIDDYKKAAAQQIKANLGYQTEKSGQDSKSALKSQEKRAAVLFSLNDLTEDLLEQKQVADDKEKLSKLKSSGNQQDAPAKKGEKADAPQAPSTQDAGSTQDAPSDDKDSRMDPLLALVMAGIDNQTQTNLIITALGAAGESISKVTTDASDQGNDWLNNFYNHGITSGNPGSYDTGSHNGDTKYYMYYHDGNYYYSTIGPDSSGSYANSYNDAIKNKPRTPPWNGIGSQDDWNKHVEANEASCKSKPWPGPGKIVMEITAQAANSTGIPGATGTANSAMFNQLVMIWQYVQQQVSQINNQFQTVAGLPSTMMQTLVQAVNTANSGQSSTVQAMGTTTNLVNGWAGV
jgi:hypothetical protein